MTGFPPGVVATLQRKLQAIGTAAETGHQKALQADALILQGAIRRTLSTQGRGRVYKSRGITSRLKGKGTKGRARQLHRASAPGDPPAPDTGQLRASVAIIPQSADLIRVGPTVAYAAALEFGTGARALRSVRFRRGPQLNRKRLASTLRRSGAYSLARSVLARGGSGGRILPRPFMQRSLDAARPQMVASHVSTLQQAILDAAR